MRQTSSRHYRARVAIDDFGPFPGWVRFGERWNGWACPVFDRDTVEQIIETQNVAVRRGEVQVDEFRWDEQDPRVLLQISDTYNSQGDTLYPLTGRPQVRGQDQTGTPAVERIEPDADGRYGVGAYQWCWEIAAIDDPELLVLTIRRYFDGNGGRDYLTEFLKDPGGWIDRLALTDDDAVALAAIERLRAEQKEATSD